MTFLLRLLIRAYQVLLSPILSWLAGPHGGCRFEPSCSCYFLEAVERHNAWHGSLLGLARLCRCHPWASGGFDPVPVERLAPLDNFKSQISDLKSSSPIRPS